jgi:SAM-dependent methyltransferase
MSDPDPAGRAVNRAHWDEAASLHAASEFYDLEGFRRGRDWIRPFEIDELGDVAGKEMVHLQCHLGTDTLSWARHGARVVGLDFSERSIEVARGLASDCGIEAEFVCADVYDAPAALANRQFDVVYTGIGALNWLGDLARWAEVVAALLRPNGVLYLVELHPIAFGVMDDGRTLRHSIHGAEYRASDEQGTYAVPSASLTHSVAFERFHSVSDVVSAVLDAAFTLELLHEQSYTSAPWPWTVRGEDGFFRLPADWPQYPLTYSLRARKSPAP